MHVLSLRTEGLGDSTYLLCHRGAGVLVDPQRDLARFFDASREQGVQVRQILETHVHNDYVSGGLEAARQSGAELILPAGAGVAFPHTPAFHQEEIGAGGGLVIRPLHTPGHTPEHVSYLVLLDGEPVALFSGGSLLVGAAGRTDLLGEARAHQLAILQYGSLQRLAALPDAVGLYPTHGQGSFCAAGSGGGETTSTIGAQRATNPALAYADAARFAEGQLAALQPYPAYYAHMATINVLGGTPLPPLDPPTLGPDDLQALLGEVHVVDGRPREAVAAGYIPGALAVALDDAFASWVGWLLPFDAPLALVLDADQDAAEAVTDLARVGFDQVRGVLRGVEAWRDAGFPLTTFETVDLDRFAAAVAEGEADQVLDVRAPNEWEEGHLARSVHQYLPDLAADPLAEVSPATPVWVACVTGHRATVAASILEKAGLRPVVLTGAGIPDLLERLGPDAAVAPAPA